MSETTPQPPPLPPHVPTVRLAGIGARFLAFLMDVSLVGLLAAFLLVKILLPREQPVGLEAFMTAYRTYESQVETALATGEKTPPPPKLDDNEAIRELAEYTQQTLLLMFFLYFGACEWLMRGSSLGKRTFGLRSVMLGSAFPPTPLQAILRGALKAFALIGLPPISWLIFLTVPLISGRRGVHDLLTRTVVVQGFSLNRPGRD